MSGPAAVPTLPPLAGPVPIAAIHVIHKPERTMKPRSCERARYLVQDDRGSRKGPHQDCRQIVIRLRHGINEHR